jgi:hypothetical protein
MTGVYASGSLSSRSRRGMPRQVLGPLVERRTVKDDAEPGAEPQQLAVIESIIANTVVFYRVVVDGNPGHHAGQQ